MIKPRAPLHRSEFDDLADLFLTDDGAAEVAHRPAAACAEGGGESSDARAPRIAALLVVNLPVFSGPWVDQATAHLASQRGPTALLRRREGQISLDLFATRDVQQATTRATGAAPADLASIVECCRSTVAQWVVEVRPEDGGSVPAPGACDELILISGADEAAVVAAFGQIKRLDAAWRSRPIGLVVAGSEQEAARRAAERIVQACRNSLDLDVELRGIVPRMQPIASRPVARLEERGDPLTVLAGALSLPRVEPTTRRTTAAQSESESPTAPVAPAAPRVALRPRPTPAASLPSVAAAHPRHEQMIRPTTPSGRSGEAMRDADESRPAPAVGPAAPAPARTLIDLVPGLKSMDVLCPRAEDVEFAFDSNGRLHALVEEDSETALTRLHVACDWAGEHYALLSRLNPFLAAPGGARGPEVIAHLFTSRARERRHLADGSWRVHILVRDPADVGRIAAHVELN